MTLDELQAKFPGAHALFLDSPEFTPPRPGNISGDLVNFLRSRGFDIHISWTPPGRKSAKKPVRHGTILIIKGRTIDHGDRDFASYDEAQDHVLDYALDMFTEELTILA